MQLVHKLEMFHAAVGDVDKVKAFYVDLLGLKEVRDQAYGDQRWVSLEFPGGGTSINFTNVHENMKPGSLKLYFSSPDVEAAYQELTGKGVKPSKELADDWGKWNGTGATGKWFEITDPDGNRVLIIPE